MLRTNSPAYAPQFRFARAPVRPVQVDEGAMDAAIAESFPASDPPAWNPGVARPIPDDPVRNQARQAHPAPRVAAPVVGGPGVIDVSRPRQRHRTVGEVVVSVSAAAGVALLAPLAVLVVGTPLAAVVRGVLELVLWTFSSVHR